MATLLHLVRHGEVHNPDHIVYASLPGFGLSSGGRVQAREAAGHLRGRPLVAVWSSPLQRALETAAIIAEDQGLAVQTDPDLSEWRLMDRWAGTQWPQLPVVFAGELEAYLEHPHELGFAPESLSELALRMRRRLEAIHRRHSEGDVVVVSHQDPVQAARLALSGQSLARLHHRKPDHCSVISLKPGTPWREAAVWSPSTAEFIP